MKMKALQLQFKFKLTLTLMCICMGIQHVQAQFSQGDAFKVIREEQMQGNEWVQVSAEILPAGDGVATIRDEKFSVQYDAWVFFIDDVPGANWEHPARYIFFSVESGFYEVFESTQPPNDEFLFEIITGPAPIDFITSKYNSNLDPCTNTDKAFAVIISGGASAGSNWVRYWNDCSSIYAALTQVYGYKDENIYVLISDGTNPGNDIRNYDGTYTSSPLDLDGDGDNDIDFSATSGNITTVFNTLAGQMDAESSLFIYTTDHGYQISGQDAALNLWNSTTITDAQFATEVNKVTADEIMIVMEQCNSGGFIDDLQATGRVIATAADFDELSWAMAPTYEYDEFVFHWTAAIAGQDAYANPVNADSNSDGFVSMREAFLYAEANDAASETPQYSSTPVNFGEQVTLYGTPTLADIYMKDGPDDIGDEPNNITAQIWKSEAIKVNLGSLPGTVSNGHNLVTHENPRYGFTNYVYVELENRGCVPMGAGDEVIAYWTKASAGLVWPTNWINFFVGSLIHGDEIGRITLPNDLNPGDQITVKIPWTNVPNPDLYSGDNHYCVLARFVSSDDPMANEVNPIYIDANTRNNNNIVHRNMNIVNQFGNGGRIIVRNNLKTTELINICFDFDEPNTNFPFLNFGQIRCKPEEKLYEIWKSGGSASQGIEIVNGEFLIYENACLFNIALQPGEAYYMDVSFDMQKPYNPNSMKKSYTFNVAQYNANGLALGGVSYNIDATNLHPDDHRQPLSLNALAIIEGAFDEQKGLMRDKLRTNGALPLVSPYENSQTVMDTKALEIEGEDAVVDWVEVELRCSNNPRKILRRLAGLIRRCDPIIDPRTLAALSFEIEPGRYYVAVRHRNHLPIISAQLVDFTEGETVTLDLTDPKNVFGDNSLTPLSNGKFALISGDVNGDGNVQPSDKQLWQNEVIQSGYLNGDLNLDGTVQPSDKVEHWQKNVAKSTVVPSNE